MKSATADGTLGLSEFEISVASTGRPTRLARDAIGLFFTMSHTYCYAVFHCVFSTKERRKLIPPEIQPRLWAYMGGIAREHDLKAFAVGGADDHAHILLSLPATMPIAKAMREIKSASSRWMHETCGLRLSNGRRGYGAFSIGEAQIESTLTYIARQSEHHRNRDFQAEFIAFLKKHHVDYDPRYVWG